MMVGLKKNARRHTKISSGMTGHIDRTWTDSGKLAISSTVT
jgi:hypothetical protein